MNLILIFAFAAIACLLLWRGQQIRDKEVTLSREFPQLSKHHIRQNAPAGIADRGSRRAKSSSPQNPNNDPDHFISGMKEFLSADIMESDKNHKAMINYLKSNSEFLKNTSRETDEEVCKLIETYPVNGNHGQLMALYLRHVLVSDPEWAINRIGESVNPEGVLLPMEVFHSLLGKHSSEKEGRWTPEYASALGEWLDAAQAAGRFEGEDAHVAQMRFDIAMTTGNPDVAIQHFSKMPPEIQTGVIPEIAQAAHTPQERLRLLEQASKTAAPDAFRDILQCVVKESGFESARDILTRTELNPEDRDLAAAAIAGANIGPETPARAAWLLESLQSENKEALTQFAAMWAQDDYQSVPGWLKSLPEGASRDAAIKGFAPVVAIIDSASAMEWTRTLTDPAQREALLREVSHKWRRQNPDAADTYFQDK
ncbi:MAG: hypothetical protein V4727_07240 [Verrucomicrobiota bacterium]